MVEELKLKVGELTGREDFGRGIARIDSNLMKKIGVKEGDILEIEGKRKTGAVAIRSYPADIGLSIVRMDGLVRKNADASIGEFVKIRKADAKEAKHVTLAPAQKGFMLHISPNLLKQNLFMRPMTKGDIIITNPVFKTRTRNNEDIFSQFFGINIEEVFLPMGTEMRLVVVKTQPEGITQISDMTELELLPEAAEVEAARLPTVTYEDIGGLSEIVPKIREMIEVPLRRPEVFERLGVEPPAGVLLHGAPGTGKTLIAKAVANEAGANFISVAGPEFMSKFYGESEENLRRIFEEAEKNAPSIIFIDEIDAIAPKREQVVGEVERRVVSTLLTQMDGLKSRGKVIVIAATNIPNMLDPALRRTGRFDREIEIPVPDKKGRKEILQIHTRRMPLEKDVDLDRLAEITYGYVGADIAGLAKEAAMHALRRVIPEISSLKEDEPIPKEILEKLKVTKEDFDYALRMVPPSAMREVLVEIPKVKWEDVGGLEEVKEALKEAVEWPLQNPDSFKRIGIRPPHGILLYGPPGCGKTFVCKALANEAGINLIAVKGPEILTMWVGESLPFDEKIFIVENGLTKRIKINEFPSNGHEILAPTITDDYKAKNSKTLGLIKHSAPPFVYRIRTETGREIRVTGGHSLFVKENDGFREVPAECVVPNKTRIAVPAKLVPTETIEKINLIPYLKDKDYFIFVDNSSKYVKLAIEKLGIKTVAKILGLETKNVYHYIKKSNLRLSKFVKLMEESHIDYDPNSIELISRKNKLPATVTVNQDLGLFLGFWVAEGSYFTYGVRLSLSKDEAYKIKDLCQKLFGHVTLYEKKGTKGIDIYINSMLAKFLLKDILGLESGARNKKIPEIILSSSIGVMSTFLKGYFSGDGYLNKKGIEATTVSKDLANDIMTLLLYFGIVARCKEKKEKRGKCYRISFMWQEWLRTFLNKIGFFDEKKNDKLKGYLDSLWQKSYKRTPKNKIDNDVYWDLVTDKKLESYNFPYVYDISVNPTERFIAGFGCVLVHNSERKLRDVFKRAKQVAPAIILFDEIDAIAPRRGIEVGTRVTEQVVSQLLTEMSGIEEMEGISIIATTNRPDILDPALLRPGRFDRLIYVPAPDEKTRLEIFKVHTKGMPLKGVNLEKLAKETEGYSGADIEALCREAAMFALREDIKAKEVTSKHFEKALKKVKPSITEDMFTKYQKAVEDLKKTKMEETRYIG